MEKWLKWRELQGSLKETVKEKFDEAGFASSYEEFDDFMEKFFDDKAFD